MLAGMTSPPKRYTRIIIGLIAAILLALTGTLVMVAYLTQRTEAPSAAGVPIPVISNIPRPNVACTPAADRKLGASDDLTSILFVGYVDGRQMEMLVGAAMSLQINGHKVEYVWYCPLRSQW